MMKIKYLTLVGAFVMVILLINLSAISVNSLIPSGNVTETTTLIVALIKDKQEEDIMDAHIYDFKIIRGFSITVTKMNGGKSISRSFMKNISFSIIDGEWINREGDFKGVIRNHFVIGIYKLEFRSVA